MTKQEDVKAYCSKCTRCLTDEKGVTFVAFALDIYGLDKHPQIREQLGKYAPSGDRVVFNFCYECFIDSLLNGSPYWEGWSE